VFFFFFNKNDNILIQYRVINKIQFDTYPGIRLSK